MLLYGFMWGKAIMRYNPVHHGLCTVRHNSPWYTAARSEVLIIPVIGYSESHDEERTTVV